MKTQQQQPSTPSAPSTLPSPSETVLAQWPPEVHIVFGNVAPGKRALCGARLMGIDMTGTPDREVCTKCRAEERLLDAQRERQ